MSLNDLKGSRTMNIENMSRMVHLESNGCSCQVCGCDFVSCVCANMSSGDTKAGSKRPVDSCHGHGHAAKRFCSTEKTLRKFGPKSERESNRKDMVQDSTLESKATEAPIGRRPSDAPAVVPIKKRRIQIAEVTRSPSPPPKLSPPQSPQSAFPGKWPAVGSNLLSAISSLPLAKSSSPPPRSPAPTPRSVGSPLKVSLKSQQPLRISVSPLRGLAQIDCVLSKVEAAEFEEGELPDESPCLVGLSMTSKDTIYQVDESVIKQDKHQDLMGMNEFHRNEQDTPSDAQSSPESSKGELARSGSGSFRQDDRLHWDLNTEMATWDEDSANITDYEAAVKHPSMSISINANESSHKNKKLGYASDQDDEEQLKEQPEVYVHENNDKEQGLELETGEIRSGEVSEEQELRTEVMVNVVETREKNVEEGLEEPTIHEEAMEQGMEKAQGNIEQDMEDDLNEKQGLEEMEAMVKAITGTFVRREVVEHKHKESTSEELHYQSVPLATGPGGYPESERGVYGSEDSSLDGGDGLEGLSACSHEDDDVPERCFLRYDKQVKSISDDGGEGWNHVSEEPELEEHVDYGDSDFRDADEMGADVDDRAQEESTWNEEGEEDEMFHGGSQKLPSVEGEIEVKGVENTHDKDERHKTSLEKRTRSRASGWDILPEGFDNAEEALRAAKEMPPRRGGRSVSWSSVARRGSLASSHSAGRFGPAPPTRTTPRDGFSSGRAEGYYGDRHSNELVDGRDRFRPARRPDDDYNHNVCRGRDPVRRPGGSFGRGRVGGWMDSQPTNHMDEWGPPGRHQRSSSFSGPPSGANRENNGYLDGPASRIGPGRGGVRSTISGGRGSRGGQVHVGRGPSGGDMDGRGVHYPLRSERVLNAGGRGFGTSSGPGFGGMHDRGRGGMMDRYRSGGMDSRRSMSPHRPYPLDHPRDHPSMMSRVASMRPESRVVRSRTPPSSSHHRSLGHPQFSGGRTQHSPPSRWSSERREADSYHPDMDFRGDPSRPRVPMQRTSPHVVHGSSLTDERDRQVLAGGSKHSPSLKSSSNYTHIRSRDDDNLDPQRSNRIEGDTCRQVGPFSRDGEFRRSSPPTRVDDREREKGELYKRVREREDDRRREPYMSSSRDVCNCPRSR